MKKRTLIYENIFKNIFIIILSLILYPLVIKPIKEIGVEQMNDFLLILSILLVSVCFANFEFSYQKSKIESLGERMFLHIVVIPFGLLLTLLLLSLVTAVGVVYPTLELTILLFSFLLYIGMILYDFWDILRAE
jgi:hypothetical protein